jgi:hypothetical protein
MINSSNDGEKNSRDNLLGSFKLLALKLMVIWLALLGLIKVFKWLCLFTRRLIIPVCEYFIKEFWSDLDDANTSNPNKNNPYNLEHSETMKNNKNSLKSQLSIERIGNKKEEYHLFSTNYNYYQAYK